MNFPAFCAIGSAGSRAAAATIYAMALRFGVDPWDAPAAFDAVARTTSTDTPVYLVGMSFGDLRAALLEGLVSLEIAMRPDVEAMKADIEQSVALLRRRL